MPQAPKELVIDTYFYFSMECCLSCSGECCDFVVTFLYRVPTRIGKPGKMGRHFPVREKSGNFKQTGKVRENHTKYWKTEIN